jgi:hypothetical protein
VPPKLLEQIQVPLCRRTRVGFVEPFVIATPGFVQHTGPIPDDNSLAIPVRVLCDFLQVHDAGQAAGQLQQAVSAAHQGTGIADEYADLGLAAATRQGAHGISQTGIIKCSVVQARAQDTNVAAGALA